MSWLKYLKILVRLLPCIKDAKTGYDNALSDDGKIDLEEGADIALNFVECIMGKLNLKKNDKDNLYKMIRGIK